MNTTAYTDTFSDFMEHAHVHGYSTESVALDQAMLKRYLQGFTTLLPDLFNYKPYWGAPQPVTGMPSGEPVIIHMQGPKPYRAVCALKDFKDVSELRRTSLGRPRDADVRGTPGGRTTY